MSTCRLGWGPLSHLVSPSRRRSAADAYARHKEAYIHTAEACHAQGIRFLLMVVETTRYWESGAARVLKEIAAQTGVKSGPSTHPSCRSSAWRCGLTEPTQAALRQRAELE